MGEKGVGKLSRETPPPREGEPMGAERASICLKNSPAGAVGVKPKRTAGPQVR